MKVVAYSSSGVPIDTLSNISAAPPQVAVRAETRQSCFDSNSAVSSDDFSVIHMRLLRCIGTLCIIFGTIEIGLGGSLFVFFSNVRAGAWWSVVLVVIAGFGAIFIEKRKSLYMLLVISLISITIALTGFFSDIEVLESIKNMSVCGESDGEENFFTYYGLSADYGNVVYCVEGAMKDETFTHDTCYCSDNTGSICGAYKLSKLSIDQGEDCGIILTHYIPSLKVSSIFCIMSFFFVLILSFLTCFVLYNKKSSSNVDVDVDEYLRLDYQNGLGQGFGTGTGSGNDMNTLRIVEARAVINNNCNDEDVIVSGTSYSLCSDVSIDINHNNTENSNDNYHDDNNYNNNNNNNDNNNNNIDGDNNDSSNDRNDNNDNGHYNN